MTNEQIKDELYEALNGLTIGWQLANVKDNAQREYLQAPVIAAQEAITRLLNHFDPKGEG